MARLKLVPFPQAAPLALILIVVLLLPMCALVVVSLFDYDSVQIIPACEFTNYTGVLGSAVIWRTCFNTFRYTVIIWAVTGVLCFAVACVLAVGIRGRATQMVPFLSARFRSLRRRSCTRRELWLQYSRSYYSLLPTVIVWVPDAARAL